MPEVNSNRLKKSRKTRALIRIDIFLEHRRSPFGLFSQLIGGMAIRAINHRRSGNHLYVLHGQRTTARLALECVQAYICRQIDFQGDVVTPGCRRWSLTTGKPDQSKAYSHADQADKYPAIWGFRAERPPNEQDTKEDQYCCGEVGNDFYGRHGQSPFSIFTSLQ